MSATAGSPGRSRPAPPRGRNLLLVVVAVAVSAVAASATAVALTGRSDLSASRKRVDAAWAALSPALDGRYQNLEAAATTARARLGADRAVFGDIATAVSAWPATRRLPTERQVGEAAKLEGLAGRLATTVATTPRLHTAADVNAALERLRQSDVATGRTAYNQAVASYQRVRGGFPRRLVAGALGYDDRRSFEVSVA